MESFTEWGLRIAFDMLTVILSKQTSEAFALEGREECNTMMSETFKDVCMGNINTAIAAYDTVKGALLLQARSVSGEDMSEAEVVALQSQHRDACVRLEEVLFGTSADTNHSLATFFKKDFLRIANAEAVLKERATEAIAPKADNIRTRVAFFFRPAGVQLPSDDASFVQRVLQAEAVILCADVMDSLGATARNFGDARMANQVGFLTLLQRAMHAACKLHLSIVQAHDREASRLTDEFAKVASELRVVAKLVKDFDTKVGVATLFSQHVSDGSALHFGHSCAFDGQALHMQILGILSACQRTWQQNCQELVDVIKGWMPVGWEAHLKDPAFLSRVDIMMSLVANPSDRQPNAGSALLSGMAANLRSVAKDGLGPFVSAETLSESASVGKTTADTASYSYVLMMVMQVILASAPPASREKQAKALNDELGVRFKRLCQPIVDRIRELESGAALAAIDFEKLQNEVLQSKGTVEGGSEMKDDGTAAAETAS